MALEQENIERTVEEETRKFNEIVNKIFKDEGGKGTPEERQERLFLFMEEFGFNRLEKDFLILKIQYQDLTNERMAVFSGVTPNHISRIKNKPTIQKILNYFNKDWEEHLPDLKRIAMRTIRQLLLVNDKKIQLEAAKYILSIEDPNQVSKRIEHSNLPDNPTE